jgi:hypothetical protein
VLSNPQGITVGNSQDFVYVADTGNDRIVKFGLDGLLISTWGGHGTGAGEFDRPVDLFEFNDLIYVVDNGNDRIQVFHQTGVYQTQWGGSGDGQFDAPEGIALGWGGDVYVTDTGNQRVQRFDYGGTFIEAWGGPGGGPGQFDGPLAVDTFSDFAIVGKRFTPWVYVLDSGNSRVQVFEGPCIPGLEPQTQVSSAGGDVLITPAGNGPTLDELGTVIQITLLDSCGDPIGGYPFLDIWWDDTGDGSLSMCQGGSVADGNTNGSGTTTISSAAAGGGFTQDGAYVYVAGLAIVDSPLAFEVNSPDLDGDRSVNLADVGAFAVDFHNGTYDFRSDLARDGTENLADIGVLATHMGENCP